MKEIILLNLFVFLVSPFVVNMEAQTNSETIQKNDSIISEKDNLYLLIERIYLASKAYKTGSNKFDKDIEEVDSIEQLRTDSILDFYRKTGIVETILLENKPRVVVIEEEKEVIFSDEQLMKIPADSVDSIEILYGSQALLYGLSGSICVIRVKLKVY